MKTRCSDCGSDKRGQIWRVLMLLQGANPAWSETNDSRFWFYRLNCLCSTFLTFLSRNTVCLSEKVLKTQLTTSALINRSQAEVLDEAFRFFSTRGSLSVWERRRWSTALIFYLFSNIQEKSSDTQNRTWPHIERRRGVCSGFPCAPAVTRRWGRPGWRDTRWFPSPCRRRFLGRSSEFAAPCRSSRRSHSGPNAALDLSTPSDTASRTHTGVLSSLCRLCSGRRD